MSLYGMVFGQNPASLAILATLGLTEGDVGRFRDCFVDKDESGTLRIAVYTRNGGGNREAYQDVLDQLATHPLYIEDRDDDFDSTYATIYFKVPPEFEAGMAVLASETPFNPSERWLAAIEAIKRSSP